MKNNTPSWPFCHPPWLPHSGSNKSGHPSHTTKKTRTHTRKKARPPPFTGATDASRCSQTHPDPGRMGERVRPGLGQSSATPAPNRFVDAFLVSDFLYWSGLLFFCRYSKTIQSQRLPTGTHRVGSQRYARNQFSSRPGSPFGVPDGGSTANPSTRPE